MSRDEQVAAYVAPCWWCGMKRIWKRGKWRCPSKTCRCSNA